jgi:hypothetical protein
MDWIRFENEAGRRADKGMEELEKKLSKIAAPEQGS